MSAYDNPTIIKDDSAMIWAQGLGGAGQAFMESYKASKKEREAREKEKELNDKKIAEDKKKQDIADQVFISESRYKDQEALSKIDQGLEKAGVNQSGVTLFNDYYAKTGSIEIDNALDLSRNVVGTDKAKKYSDYASQRATGIKNLEKQFGGLYSAASAIKNGDITEANISEYRFRGSNVLDQGINRVTTLALAYPDDEKTMKKLNYDASGDPSAITLEVNTKIGTLDDVAKTIRSANVSISEEEVNKQIQEELKRENSRIKVDENGVYSINYVLNVNGAEDSSLYVKIPKIDYGKAPVTAGVYSKDSDAKISPAYLTGFKYEDLKGNAGLSKEYGDVKYKSTKVDMTKIKTDMRPSLVASAQGLISSYLTDNTVADGLLNDLGFPNNYYSKEFAAMPLNEKVNALVSKMEEKEVNNIQAKSGLTKIDGEYYIIDPTEAQIFKEPSSSTSSGQTNTQKQKAATWAEQRKSILNMEVGGLGDFYSPDGKRKVSYDGSQFIIQTAGTNKEVAIPTKKGVVEYLEKGTLKLN